jgi:hypothetical protein
MGSTMTIEIAYCVLTCVNLSMAAVIGYCLWNDLSYVKVKHVIGFLFVAILGTFVPFFDVFGFVIGVMILIMEVMENESVNSWLNQNVKK